MQTARAEAPLNPQAEMGQQEVARVALHVPDECDAVLQAKQSKQKKNDSNTLYTSKYACTL